jgi:hypothetical protein
MLMQIMQLPPGSEDIAQGGRRHLGAGAGRVGRDPNKDLAERRCDDGVDSLGNSAYNLQGLHRVGRTPIFFAGAWRPGDKSFSFWLAATAKGYDVGTSGRSVSLLPLARFACRLAG